MKLSRRCFLSFVVGGAAGTALSPLPWKLTDDLSIWSQNWPWTPVPDDGEATTVASTCALCPGGCGISVRKIDARAVKIEGTPEHPVNDGGVCLLGLSGLQLLYGPTRVNAPLKRVGKRGEGRWEPISWQSAIDEVAAKLTDIRQQGNPQTVACIAERDTGTVPQLLRRLMSVYGSPNFLRMPSIEDAHQSALFLAQGIDGTVGADLENATFILSFGCALLEGYGSPVRMMQANSHWKETQAKLVQVESRQSNTASKADQWVAVNPGTEADLALAMAHVIIALGMINQSFIQRDTEGFAVFTEMVKEKYDPQAVAARIGIEAQTIIDLAKAFAGAEKPLALYGRGKGHVPGSLKEALAVHTLNALVGNINQKGGMVAVPAFDYINWPEFETDAVAAAGLQTQRLDGAGTDRYPNAPYLMHNLIRAVNENPEKLQALLIADGNPYYALQDTKAVKAALDKIPFIVSFSSYMDETAENADLILPNHVYLERYEDIPVTAGLAEPIVGLCRPAVEPQANTRHLGDTVIQIAAKVGGSVAQAFPWEDYQTCLEQTLSDHWDEMEKNGFWKPSDDIVSRYSGYQTESGKYNLMNSALGAIYAAEDAALEGDSGSYPLTFIAYDTIRLASHTVGSPPFMIKTVPDTELKEKDGFIDINERTAKRFGLSEGQRALLKTPRGEAYVRVHLSEGIAPDVIAMPRGLGHTAYGPYLAGKGVNVNQLIGPVEDPASGLNAAWGIRATLAKA